jgi:hypothetical protein
MDGYISSRAKMSKEEYKARYSQEMWLTDSEALKDRFADDRVYVVIEGRTVQSKDEVFIFPEEQYRLRNR